MKSGLSGHYIEKMEKEGEWLLKRKRVEEHYLTVYRLFLLISFVFTSSFIFLFLPQLHTSIFLERGNKTTMSVSVHIYMYINIILYIHLPPLQRKGVGGNALSQLLSKTNLGHCNYITFNLDFYLFTAGWKRAFNNNNLIKVIWSARAQEPF